MHILLISILTSLIFGVHSFDFQWRLFYQAKECFDSAKEEHLKKYGIDHDFQQLQEMKRCFSHLKCTLKNGTKLDVGQTCGENQECDFVYGLGSYPFEARCKCPEGFVAAMEENRCYCPDFKVFDEKTRSCECPEGTVHGPNDSCLLPDKDCPDDQVLGCANGTSPYCNCKLRHPGPCTPCIPECKCRHGYTKAADGRCVRSL